MKTPSTLACLALLALLACKDCDSCCEPQLEYDPTNPNYICKAPDVAKNIIGSWKFETSIDSVGIRTGYVTFDAGNRVIDPDSLFENGLDGRPIKAKTYAIKDGQVQVYQFQDTRVQPNKLVQTYPFVVRVNQCNRIKLVFSSPDDLYVLLTR